LTGARTETDRQGGTREQIVQAALDTLKAVGFAGASARGIARTGGFNQALIFYHFGRVNDLLLAALDETSARRMAAYREAMEGASSLSELVGEATRIYREDLRSGHIKVLAEMIAGSSAHPELGPQIAARVEPWIRFAEEAIGRVLAGSPLEPFIPVREAAHAVVAFYLGVELLTHLQPRRFRAGKLFDLAARTTPLLDGLLGRPSG
jgi:AcrR family transcriptional regulator